MTKTLIGNQEWCSLPELGVLAVKARVDSGARTSSIHAFNLKAFDRDGDEWVRFEIHPLQNDETTIVQCEHKVIDRRDVKSSSGAVENRYVIATPLRLGEQTWNIELTLTNRDAMGFRMLLGREAMGGRVIIDPELKMVLGQ